MFSVYTESPLATAGMGSATASAPTLLLAFWLRIRFGCLSQAGERRRWRQRCGLDGKTSRSPCRIEGNDDKANRFCTLRRQCNDSRTSHDEGCDQKSHRAIVADLGRPAVVLAAFLMRSARAWSAFGVGHSSVGQNHGIPNRWEMLSAIAFAHIFQLNRGFGRDCFCL